MSDQLAAAIPFDHVEQALAGHVAPSPLRSKITSKLAVPSPSDTGSTPKQVGAELVQPVWIG